MSRRDLVLGERWEAVLAAAAANRATEISLVGSTARGTDTPDSDVDFLVRFAPGASLLDLSRLQGALEDLLGCRVDVIEVGGLSAERGARTAAAAPVSDAQRDADRLASIGENSAHLGEIVAAGREAFDASGVSRFAAARLLELIGASTGALSTPFVAARPRLEIAGMPALCAFAATPCAEASDDVVWALAVAVVPEFMRILAEDPPLGDPAWFPQGGPHPSSVSPTLTVTRPPAKIPEDLLDRSRPKANGVVTLPQRVAWSGQGAFDLADRRQRCDAYKLVMTEGLDADVLWFVDIDEVVAMWAEMHLSPHIRIPWQRWLWDRGLLDLRTLVAGTVADVTRRYPPRSPAG